MYELHSKQIGKSLRQHWIIKSCIDVRGLPRKNFILAKHDCMVRWDCETGEVKTIEYKTKSKMTVVYDELENV